MAKYFTPSKISDNILETPEGFLVCLGVPIGRTGEMVYKANELVGEDGKSALDADSNGEVKTYRSASELFSPETMASFEGKPFTVNHPQDFVDPKNWKDLAKGVIQNIRKGDKDEDGEESLLADILVNDHMTIQMVKNGIREVSCGYDATYIQDSPGVANQVKIRGNHLALVDQGRAGPTYAINDHKLKVERPKMKTLAEKLKGLLIKTIDAEVAADVISGDELEPKKESKDALPEKKEDKKDDAKAKDADVSASLEDRLKALEMAVSKLLESESAEAEAEDDDMEESATGDEDTVAEKKEMAKKTGDSKNASTGLEQTKQVKSFDSESRDMKMMTAEDLNAKNKAFWSRK